MKTIAIGVALVAGLAAAASAQQVRMEWGAPCPPPAYSKHVPAGGYWTVQHQTVVVPGHWVWWQHPCGEYHRKWVPPCRRVVPQRVWVPYPAPTVCRR